MSGITLVFGTDVETGAQEDPNDAAEPVEADSVKKWPLKESIYVRVFKGTTYQSTKRAFWMALRKLPLVPYPSTDAIATILEHESFLLRENEILYLNELQIIPIESLYILIRLALRKDGWHRKSDYERYAADMDHEAKLEEAIRTLCPPQQEKVMKDKFLDVGGDFDAPIDLTCDSDAEEDTPTSRVKKEQAMKPSSSQALDFDLSYHALSHDSAGSQELLDMLTMDELGKLAKDYNVKGTNKNRKELVTAILQTANSQSTLSFFTRSKPLQHSNFIFKSKNKSGGRLKALCLKYLVHCIKLNPHVILLIRRINLLFFRTTTYEAQLFVPAILVACRKRTYSLYNSTRTNRVFESRDALLRYEQALELEVAAEKVVEKLHASGAEKKLRGANAWQDLEMRLVELYNSIIQGYNACLTGMRDDQRYGLERFEAGYVYARTLYHIAFPMGKIDGVDTELQILGNLLSQKRWLLGKRGGCYDRIACIHMKDLKSRENIERAHDIVTRALTDDETRFRYRPKLVRRLARLENALDIPASERHICTGEISKCKEVYILGERAAHIDEEEKPAVQMAQTVGGYVAARSPVKNVAFPVKRISGKTLWESENGSLIGIEEFALQHYAREGFKGKHCEGHITRFLFALLFYDILFHPSVPGAFETAYQIAPLDLVHDTFYSSRKELIDTRLEELLLPGKASEIVGLRDGELRGSNVFFVGGRWDAFGREEIMEIVEYMPEQVIHDICLVQARDFEASGGGVPDLILWSAEREEVKFVEVKSANDKLSETQKLWIHHLVNAGEVVEVCHVETAEDRTKREDTKKHNRERAKSRTSRSVAFHITHRRGRRKRLFEEGAIKSESEGGADREAAVSDWEDRDLEGVKVEGEDVKSSLGRGRKRASGVEEEEGSQSCGTRKRVKKE